MKKWWIALVALAAVACGEPQKQPAGDELQAQSSALLYEWLDALLAQQIDSEDPAVDGGFLCPACNRVHGRCPDAILPLMYAADQTGEQKYLDAALRLWDWLEYNVSMPDGAWVNDVNIADWKGTTVFAVIAIGEALERYGHLLPAETVDAWWARLERAAQYVYDDEQNFAPRLARDPFFQNINYPASSPYALWMVGKRQGRQDFLDRAAQTAIDIRSFFSPENCLLYGEAPVKGPTTKGAWPVDLGYNVEESLPNLAFYAQAVGDSVLMDIVVRSMRSHLEFMLPDGAWDNSWGTRSFKWTYWGSRTSDGMMAGYYLCLARHPEFLTAISRNVGLLRKMTLNGMLYGGMHYASAGLPPCNHHTFSHARGMASFLAIYRPGETSPWAPLPRDEEYGVKEIRDLRTWLVSEGGWRATVTDMDAEYRVRGTHPKGGALSVLWHKDIGPIFAAGMNTYLLIEPTNMQMDRQAATTSPTPRIEYEQGGVLYTSIDDSHAKVTPMDGKTGFSVECSLANTEGGTPPAGQVRVAFEYEFSPNAVIVSARLLTPAPQGEVRLVLPFIADNGQSYALEGAKTVRIEGPGGSSYGCMAFSPGLRVGQVNPNGRILCFTPGFEVIPVIIPLEKDKPTEVHVFVSDGNPPQ